VLSPLNGSVEQSPKLGATQAADVHVALGRSLEKSGALQEATTAYLEAIKLDPHRADACARLAVIHDLQAKFKESEAYHRKALAAQPENADLYCNYGYSLYLQRRWAEAEDNLRRAVALQADHRRAHNNLGLVLGHNGRAEEALTEFRKAGCREADAHINLAFVLTLEQSWPEARKHYEHALLKDPNAAQARKGLDELNTFAARAELKAQAGEARAH
jgi:Tfp pilus assembly protein PilF